MTTWHRGLDRQARLFTFAKTDNRVFAYFPYAEGTEFRTMSGGLRRNDDDRPVEYWRDEIPIESLDRWKAEYEIVEEAQATAIPGHFFPRLYRKPEHPPIDVSARTATMRATRGLLARLRDVFQVVEPTRAHDTVFGHELRQLLILACTEVESSWRAILAANDYPSGSGHWSTKDYVKLLGPMKLDKYVVTLASHPAYGKVAPFHGWNLTNPTLSLAWYDSYNHTKHNREQGLDRATMAVAIQAMAAGHIMTVAQFGFDEIEHGHFHADEFNFERTPTWIGDAYIRPLLMPEKLLTDECGRFVDWPEEWVKGDCPF